ncbi:arginine--tRNA ligase [Candidatus Woesearchaeota archaeon]|nr:arginine--tRNA ligase [Candidatus Woesearchaeota archaeon]
MYKEQLQQHLQKILGLDVTVEIPPDNTLGDYSLPCFAFAKQRKQSPAQIATAFLGLLSDNKPPYISTIETKGPYLNFTLNKTMVAQQLIPRILQAGKTYGHSLIGKGKTVVIEYASPNTNKPLHLGHLRNIALGSSLSTIYASQGYSVVRANIVNDRGIHICKAMLAYALEGHNATPEQKGRKPDHFVGDYYVKFGQLEKEDPSLIQQAQDMLQKWEQGDKEIRKLWKLLRNWCQEGFEETYEQLETGFDRIDYESDIWKEGKDIVIKGLDKGVFIKDETGAVIAPLEDLEIEGKKGVLPNKVLLRSDGTTLYMTQDMYLAVKREADLHFDELIYVVGSEQILHFKELFAILQLLGYDWVHGCTHLAHGMVYLPEGKMKSREGIVVDADDMILQMTDLAREEIVSRDNTMREEQVHERAHSVGLAALKFMLLKIDAHKDTTFDPQQSISFEGDTGPYLQYTYARAASILRNLEDKHLNATFEQLEDLEEELVMQLLRFSQYINEALTHKKPHLIIHYLLDLCQLFNEFYHRHHVLNEADEEKRANRIALVQATKQVIGNGLQLVGIRPIERM